jgi:5-methylcytosine-specific restriction enzyme A
MKMAKLSSGTTARAVEEWRGKTPDSKPPPEVRLRIFDRHGGICQRSSRKIAAGEKWALDHIIALADGGTNTERNLAPVLVGPHKEKTAAEAAVRSKVKAKRKSHLGIKEETKRPIQSRNTLATGKPKGEKLPLPERVGGIRFEKDRK